MDRRTELANAVLVGHDEWLFHRDNFSFEQFGGHRPLALPDLQRWQQLLEHRHNWLKQRNAAYWLFVVPEKHVVYADKLPSGMTISDGRPALQLQRRLQEAGSPVRMVYPVENLIAHRAERETFWKSGTHWNSFGAFLAYRDLLAEITRVVPAGRPIEWDDLLLESRMHAGDIGVRLDPEPMAEELLAHIKRPLARRIFHNRGFGRGATVVYGHPDKHLPRAVFFRDSSLSWMERFLAENFSRMVCVSTIDLYFDLIEAERPEVVVSEMIERYVNDPGAAPRDSETSRFEELTGVPTVTLMATAERS